MKDIWKAQLLAQRLRDGSLSEMEKFKYLLIWVALMSLGTTLVAIPWSEYRYEPTWMDAVNELFSIAILFFGLAICFQTNAQGDNRAFTERLMCLSLPVFIEIVIAWAIVSLCLDPFLDQEHSVREMIDTIVLGIGEVVFYLRVNHLLKFVSRAEPPSNAAIA